MAEFYPELLNHPAIRRFAAELLERSLLEVSERSELRDALKDQHPFESAPSLNEAFASLFGHHLNGLDALRKSAGLFGDSSPAVSDIFNISSLDNPFFVTEMLYLMRNYFFYYRRARLAMYIDSKSSLFIWGHKISTRHAEIIGHFAGTPDGEGISSVLSILEYLEEDTLKLTGYREREHNSSSSISPQEWRHTVESISSSAALEPFVSALTLHNKHFEMYLDPGRRSEDQAISFVDKRDAGAKEAEEALGEQMLTADVRTGLSKGLHARTILELIKIADRYGDEATIFLEPKSGPRKDERMRVGNSALMTLMTAGLAKNSEMRLVARGSRAAELLAEACAHITGEEAYEIRHTAPRSIVRSVGDASSSGPYAARQDIHALASCQNRPLPLEYEVMSMRATTPVLALPFILPI